MKTCTHRSLNASVHSSIAHSSQQMETIQSSNARQVYNKMLTEDFKKRIEFSAFSMQRNYVYLMYRYTNYPDLVIRCILHAVFKCYTVFYKYMYKSKYFFKENVGYLCNGMCFNNKSMKHWHMHATWKHYAK